MLRRCNSVLVACALALAPAGLARAHDFDGDGRDDLFWRNADTGANVVWRSANAATPQSILGVTNTRWTVEGVGDFDGDGRADLLWRQRTTGANVIWLSGNAATPRAVATVASVDWHVAGVGDFDGDGRADILWRNLRSGANQVWRAGLATQVANSSVRVPTVVAGIGDFDGDGADDVLWRNTNAGANVVWPSASPLRARTLANVADEWWQIEGVGDFDGDGRDDLMWRHLADGRNLVWPSGDAAQSRALPGVTFLAWHVAATGDYDGDGRDDLFWRNDDDGRNAIWRSANATTALRPTAVGNPAWSLMPFEAQPTLPVIQLARPAPVVEGNSGTRTVVVRIRLSHPAALPVPMVMGVEEGSEFSIVAAPGVDFTWLPSNLQLEFAPGETTVDLRLPVLGDTVAEANEPIVFWPMQVNDAYVLRFDGVLTILNDDANTLWIDSALMSDEFQGTRPMNFVVHLSRPQATAVSFLATTTPGRATAGVDYVARSARLTIPPGATEATFAVDVLGDAVLEGYFGESFGVQLSQVSGVLPVLQLATGRIIDRSYRRVEP